MLLHVVCWNKRNACIINVYKEINYLILYFPSCIFQAVFIAFDNMLSKIPTESSVFFFQS